LRPRLRAVLTAACIVYEVAHGMHMKLIGPKIMGALARKSNLALLLLVLCCFAVADADAATVVALGASNTYGKGVARNEAYPAQLEAILRASGSNVEVVNAGISGDTTEGMLRRLDAAVPSGTTAVILQPGGNDQRKGSPDRTRDIQSSLSARHIPVILLPNAMLRGLPHQPDGQHLTPEGYHRLAQALAPQVLRAIRR
jgi:acyl-CoA thioesterase-1